MSSDSKKPLRLITQVFRKSWLKDPSFAEWLEEDPSDKTKAFCKVCFKAINAHRSALSEHACEKRHLTRLERYIDQLCKEATIHANGNIEPGSEFEEVRDSDEDYIPDADTVVKLEKFSDSDEDYLPKSASKKTPKSSKKVDKVGKSSLPRKHFSYQRFKAHWLEDDAFKGWLREVPNKPTSAYCAFCRCILHAHKSDLRSHAKSKKHRRSAEHLKNVTISKESEARGMRNAILRMKKEVPVDGAAPPAELDDETLLNFTQEPVQNQPKSVGSRIVSAVLLRPPPPNKYPDPEELIVKVRIANMNAENDFLEVELPRSELTCHRLVQTCAETFSVDPTHIDKIRKLPNTLVHRDKEVRRLADYQELELVMKEYVIDADNLVNAEIVTTQPSQHAQTLVLSAAEAPYHYTPAGYLS